MYGSLRAIVVRRFPHLLAAARRYALKINVSIISRPLVLAAGATWRREMSTCWRPGRREMKYVACIYAGENRRALLARVALICASCVARLIGGQRRLWRLIARRNEPHRVGLRGRWRFRRYGMKKKAASCAHPRNILRALAR